uniref:Ovule protein n=1 Tax=Steinernema glaseri TaxID=37863 RepID=A0A1I8A9A6_9BILA
MVPINHSIWVQHRDYFEDEIVPYFFSIPISRTFHHPAGVTFSWMNSGGEKYDVTLAHVLLRAWSSNSEDRDRVLSKSRVGSRRCS